MGMEPMGMEPMRTDPMGMELIGVATRRIDPMGVPATQMDRSGIDPMGMDADGDGPDGDGADGDATRSATPPGDSAMRVDPVRRGGSAGSTAMTSQSAGEPSRRSHQAVGLAVGVARSMLPMGMDPMGQETPATATTGIDPIGVAARPSSARSRSRGHDVGSRHRVGEYVEQGVLLERAGQGAAGEQVGPASIDGHVDEKDGSEGGPGELVDGDRPDGDRYRWGSTRWGSTRSGRR